MNKLIIAIIVLAIIIAGWIIMSKQPTEAPQQEIETPQKSIPAESSESIDLSEIESGSLEEVSSFETDLSDLNSLDADTSLENIDSDLDLIK